MVEKIIPWWRKALSYAMSGIRSLLRPGRSNAGEARDATADREEKPEIEGSVKQASPQIEVVAAAVQETAQHVSASEVEAVQEVTGRVDEVAAQVVAEAAHPNVEEEIAAVEAHDADAPGAEALIESVDVVTESAQETTAEVKAILETVVEVEAESVAVHAVLVAAMSVAEMDSEAIHAVETVELAVEEENPEVIAAESEQAPPLDVETVPPVEPEEALPVESVETAAENAIAAPIESPAEAAIAPALEEQAAAEHEPVVESAAEAEAEPAQAASEPETAAEDAPRIDAPQPVAVKSEAEQKMAARVAAAIKAREESSDPSPFSICVGHVYDGPLDLLLDLIRKQDIDIYDIPIAKITAQFLAYVNQLKASDMDTAGEFIYTASLLIHIKSKMLLPRTSMGPEDAAEDPRRELVERLLEHERFKNAAQMLQQKQMLEAATWTNPGVREFREDAGAEPEIAADTTDLVRVFQEILERARNRPIINVEEDSVTMGQMIQFLARRLTMEDKPVALRKLLSHTRSERALIAMFLALLELVRLQAILLRQDRHFSEIFIKKHSGFEAAMDQGLAGARDDWR